MNTYVSSGAFRVRTIRGVIDEALRLGVSKVELSSGLAHDPQAEETIRLGLDAGLQFLIHNYFPAPKDPQVLNLSASNDADLAWSISHCKHAVDLAVLVDCPFYSLHAGYAVPLTAELLGKPAAQAAAMKETRVDRRTAYTRMLEAVREVADYAAEFDKRLLIENNVISPTYLSELPENPLLMTSADEIERFMNDVDRSNVGFLIDVGHARVSATALGFDPIKFMKDVEPYTEALHLSDNDAHEDQNLPFDKTAWFWPLMELYTNKIKVLEAYSMSDADLTSVLESLSIN